MDGLTLLRRAYDVGLRLEASGDKLVIRGPKRAAPVVKLLAEHKAVVLAALADTAHDAEVPSLAPWFDRVISPAEGEPGLEMPCASRRMRVEVRPDGLLLHFCAECGAWGAFGYGVNLCAGRLGRWYCAAHRPQGATP
jgi:hypothetical protein